MHSPPARRRFLQISTTCALAAPAVGAARTGPGGAPDNLALAAHLLNRVGFGPRPGDLARVAADPQAWLAQQLAPATAAPPADLAARLREDELRGADPLAAVRQLIARQREDNQSAAAAAPAEPAMAAPAPAPSSAASAASAAPPGQPATAQGRYARQVQLPAWESRLWRALASPHQLQEVMVDFWFNHFNVFQGKNWMRVLVGAYEHQAIRPHALGRFRDLLGATAHHPGMLYYLDNWLSVGARGNGVRGLNENYARELMELHTLGVDGGYTQADVTQLARMLTGWTFGPVRPRDAAPPADAAPAPMPGFWFNARVHDAGAKQWLGQAVAGTGKAEGDHALDLLARHPATARHIAWKLAQHFVADRPDEALVRQLADVFQREDGHIVPVLQALFQHPAFTAPQALAAKFKTPYHYQLSTLRAVGATTPAVLPLVATLDAHGMPLFGCPTPDGWKNTEAAWLNPDGMSRRINFASAVAAGRLGRPGAERLHDGLDLDQLQATLGPLATAATRDLAQQHRTQPELAAALLLAGPGMMRR